LFPKLKEDLRGQNVRSDKEVRLQHTSDFGRKEDTFLRMEFRNLLNVDKSILKLEESMWKSDYAQL
jgi:hypothetical protein